jgi:hypothetical protein
VAQRGPLQLIGGKPLATRTRKASCLARTDVGSEPWLDRGRYAKQVARMKRSEVLACLVTLHSPGLRYTRSRLRWPRDSWHDRDLGFGR